jgi:outer membrane receptor protein involved in Fe transport
LTGQLNINNLFDKTYYSGYSTSQLLLYLHW